MKMKKTLAHHKKIDLKDWSYMVVEACSLVKSTTLRRAWNKLKGISTKQEVQKDKEDAKKNRKRKKKERAMKSRRKRQ